MSRLPLFPTRGENSGLAPASFLGKRLEFAGAVFVVGRDLAGGFQMLARFGEKPQVFIGDG